MDSSDLNVILVSNRLEVYHLCTELGKLDVDGSTHASATVGGAGGDVTKMLVVSELSLGLDESSGLGESLEDLADVGALLHGDNTELILLIDPDEESLGVVVEDATGLRPLTLETTGLEVLVATLK